MKSIEIKDFISVEVFKNYFFLIPKSNLNYLVYLYTNQTPEGERKHRTVLTVVEPCSILLSTKIVYLQGD